MEVADWEAAAFEPSSAATATLEVPGVSSAKAGVANVASIRIAHAKKEGRAKPEHRTSCDAYRCKTVPCMSALCSIQLLNGDDANTLEGSAGRVNRWKTWWLEMRGFGKRGFRGLWDSNCTPLPRNYPHDRPVCPLPLANGLLFRVDDNTLLQRACFAKCLHNYRRLKRTCRKWQLFEKSAPASKESELDRVSKGVFWKIGLSLPEIYERSFVLLRKMPIEKISNVSIHYSVIHINHYICFRIVFYPFPTH